MQPINVFSAFDGMSCGQLALERADIPYNKYYASEIDKYAIQVTQANYPDTIQLGDITKIDHNQYPTIDLMIGGSPCQGFSFAGKGLNFSDPRSRLFFTYVRLLRAINPKYFILENVRMRKDVEQVISNMLGCKPLRINSALVSAQNRERLYWTNIPQGEELQDHGIVLSDIIEDGFVDRDKAYCLDANYWKGGNLKSYFEKRRRQLVFCGAQRGRYIVDGKRQDGKMKTAGLTKQRIEMRYDGKTNTLTTVQKDNNVCYGADGRKYYAPEEITHRKLTPVECERLQTVPDNYTNHVSNTQRYKMLGNGWTVSVVAHILKGLLCQDK